MVDLTIHPPPEMMKITFRFGTNYPCGGNHIEERLLVKHRRGRFALLGGHLCNIPQSMISDI